MDMTLEAPTLYDFEQRVRETLARRKLPIDAKEFITVLASLGDASAPTTAHDHDFLIAHAGLTEDDLSDDALRVADATIAANRAHANKTVANESWKTETVAEKLGMIPANVRRAVAEGAIYSVKPTPGSHHRYPAWQFINGRPLPGMREVITALPDDYHPLEVKDFMTEPVDALRDMSPVQWLAEGGAIDDVVTLAQGRGWE